MSIESLLDKEDRDYERRERLDALEKLRPQTEQRVWKPPTPEQIELWRQQQTGKRRKRRSTR